MRKNLPEIFSLQTVQPFTLVKYAMSEAHPALVLKSVASLFTAPAGGSPDSDPVARYHIPAYQRGYRWRPEQVEALLNDLRDFIQNHQKGTARSSIYCLQPLVVAKPKKSEANCHFEIVDGQQRLTTLFLIFSFLRSTTSQDSSPPPLFKLHFETREEANQVFLEEIATKETEDAQTIDQYHYVEAYHAIRKWFGKEANTEVGMEPLAFLSFLQEGPPSEEHAPHAAVIWYELDSNDDPVAAFTRLNIGKIQLTNDELIRALFLRRANEEDPAEETAQFQMALLHKSQNRTANFLTEI